MAFRSLTRPLGLTYKPLNRATPSLFNLKKSYSATTPNVANNKDSKDNKDVKDTIKTDQVNQDELKATTEKVANELAEEKKEDEKKEEKVEEKEEGYEFGAFHWNMERGAAIALIPLMSTQVIYGAHPVADGLLGVVLPFHIYMGFDSCITDYIPKRVYPRLHKAANWTLGGTTGLVMWGCYEFNTNDIGIMEFAQRFFAA
ncbi:CybS-domain-containing protein [Helicostylum pulchrum]|nr:CybS-domain-containing protein [Helicostylum pulchrum]